MKNFEEAEYSINHDLLNAKQIEHHLSSYQIIDYLQVSPYEFKLIINGQKPLNDNQIESLSTLLKVSKKDLLKQSTASTKSKVENRKVSALDLLHDVQINK